MAKRRLPRKDATPGERLRRVGEQPEPFGKSPEISIENLIVIGASAGGHTAIKEVVRGLSRDIPAAVIIMLHMGTSRETSRVPQYQLENALREFAAVPVAAVQSGDRVQRGMIYVTPPGQSVFLQGRTLHLEPRKTSIPLRRSIVYLSRWQRSIRIGSPA